MIISKLNSLKEPSYKEFSKKIIHTNLEILGIKMANLRNLAKQIAKSDDVLDFINSDKDQIYEMVMLEGLVISYANLEFKTKINLYNNYIQKADNWALIDSIKFKQIDDEIMLENIKIWLKSEDEFIIRAGLVNLIYYFINLENLDFIFSLKFEDNKYYAMMAHAWLLAECMTKFPSQTLKFMKRSKLDKKTHNKAISKMIDSFKISTENKKSLKYLKK